MCPRYLVSTVLIICLMSGLSHAASNYDQAARDLILKIHNDKRAAEGGCHINRLIYDQELENQARSWAERCVFKHELKEGRGENLAWDSNQKDEKSLIESSSQGWFDEKKTYSYGQRSCATSQSCHYTQFVWGKTNRVGCWSTRCGNLVGATRNAWYFVCFYTPKGNWNGEKPYEKGCSSQCLEGQTADSQGLCLGEPTEAKGQGPSGGGACVDDQGNCARWAKMNQCTANPEYMKVHCKKACGLC